MNRMEKRQMNQRLTRERAVYDYLEALDRGDIDGLIETLEQAIYDAPLDEMLIDAHHAYFQDGQASLDELAEVDTCVDLPVITPLAPRIPHREPSAQTRRFPLWARVLAAVLIVAVLVGSFVAIQVLYRANAPHTNVVAPPSVCQPSPWQISSTSATGILFSVAASSPGDAWAVGETFDQNPLIEHWDGVKWHVMSSPQLRGKGGYLQVIAIVAPNDIWAAGEQFQGGGPAIGPIVAVSRGTMLIEHWDGKNWAVVASPESKPDPQSTTEVNSITVISAHNIWIAGAWIDHGLNPNTPTALLEHWDGQKWTRVLDQSVLENGTSAGVILDATTNAGGQVLAGGTQRGNDQAYHAYLERWDGQRWSKIDTSSLGPHVANIFALSAVSASDMWAIVENTVTSASGSPGRTIVHWDGKTWKQISAPDWLVGKNTYAWSIRALGPRNIWAMNASPSVLAHWDGTSWNQVKLPNSTLHLETFANDFAVSAGAIWVVGRIVGDGSSTHPLLEQQITCP